MQPNARPRPKRQRAAQDSTPAAPDLWLRCFLAALTGAVSRGEDHRPEWQGGRGLLGIVQLAKNVADAAVAEVNRRAGAARVRPARGDK
jgi:hypothetical protein